MIRNWQSFSNGTANDVFSYTLTLTPSSPYVKTTAKITQTTYSTEPETGNSEIAKQTLSYTNDAATGQTARAYVADNPVVPLYNNSIGDYIMGEQTSTGYYATKSPYTMRQLRIDSSSTTELYYFQFAALANSNNNVSPYRLSTNNNQVYFSSNNPKGTLPPNPTLARILKSNVSPTSYAELATNHIIPSGSSYVSYAVSNTDSLYVINIENPKTVTLTYRGIMHGNSSFIYNNIDYVGETFREWISFGIESSDITKTFSGIVFNDNGGITAADSQDTSATYTGNASYFNGQYDSAVESGIAGSTITVAECAGSTSTTEFAPQTVTVNADGTYNFSFTAEQIGDNTQLCFTQTEPSGYAYPVDTTSNTKVVSLSAATNAYTNINFGDVVTQNAALVLKKYQYVHACDDSLDLDAVENNDDGTLGYSINPVDAEAGQCIAYKIMATNRGHVNLSNIIIEDNLQTDPESVLRAPLPQASKSAIYSSTSEDIYGQGQILSDAFSLAAAESGQLYFNTKYGTVH